MTTDHMTPHREQPITSIDANKEVQALTSVYSLLLRKSRERQAKIPEADIEKVAVISMTNVGDSLGTNHGEQVS